jgi:hypothetical protein
MSVKLSLWDIDWGYKIWGFHGCEYASPGLLGYNAIYVM